MMDNDWMQGAEGRRINIRRGAQPGDIEFAIGKATGLFAAISRTYSEIKQNVSFPVEIDDRLNAIAEELCILNDRMLEAKYRLEDQ